MKSELVQKPNGNLEYASGLVCAIPPLYQQEQIHKVLNKKNIREVILEKPLAVSPRESRRMINKLQLMPISYRIGYTFLQTDWFGRLKLVSEIDIRMKWEFNAHHFLNEVNTWKRYHSKGGGVVRFYGIHLIPILYQLNFHEIVSSRIVNYSMNQPSSWKLKMNNKEDYSFQIEISTNSNCNRFIIEAIDQNNTTETICSIGNPFSENINILSLQDKRIAYLEKLIKTLKDRNMQYVDLYKETNNIWERIEEKTYFDA